MSNFNDELESVGSFLSNKTHFLTDPGGSAEDQQRIRILGDRSTSHGGARRSLRGDTGATLLSYRLTAHQHHHSLGRTRHTRLPPSGRRKVYTTEQLGSVDLLLSVKARRSVHVKSEALTVGEEHYC